MGARGYEVLGWVRTLRHPIFNKLPPAIACSRLFKNSAKTRCSYQQGDWNASKFWGQADRHQCLTQNTELGTTSLELYLTGEFLTAVEDPTEITPNLACSTSARPYSDRAVESRNEAQKCGDLSRGSGNSPMVCAVAKQLQCYH